MKTKIGIGVLIIFIVGVIFIISSSSKNTSYKKSYQDTKTITDQNTTNNTTTNTKTYTMSDIASHNNKQNCFTVVNSNVYDVTSWINQHPGGAQAILYMCGKDATALFEGQHGGQRRPEAELQSFLIGKLK